MITNTLGLAQLARTSTHHVCRQLKLLWWPNLLSNKIRHELPLSRSALGLRYNFLLFGSRNQTLNLSPLDRILLDNDV